MGRTYRTPDYYGDDGGGDGGGRGHGHGGNRDNHGHNHNDHNHDRDHRKAKLKRLALTRCNGERLILALGGIGARITINLVRDQRSGELRVSVLVDAPAEVVVAREEVASEDWLRAVGMG